MRRSLIGAMTLVLFVATGACASEPAFLFGAWTNESPLGSSTDSAQFYRMLHDTLHFNTILGQCFTPTYLSLIESNGLHVISSNGSKHPHFLPPEDADTLTYWPRAYGESAYGIWQSEGSHLGPCELSYRGGQKVNVDGVSVQHFAATSARVDSVIQTGPSEGCCDSCYGQIPWYYGDLAGGDQRYHYEVFIRFKLGPDLDTLNNSDTIAVFYVERTGIPFQSDTLLKDAEEVVYVLDTITNSAFDWSPPVKCNLGKIQSCTAYQCRYVYDMNFKVRWFGQRDIYIDQVKIMNTQGRELWEFTDTTTAAAFKHLREFSNRFFGDSPTVLGWYVMDDQYVRKNRDNLYSMRRVDSLLTTWAPHKKAFVIPAAYPDVLDITGYSNLSYQIYPIFAKTSTNSDYAPEGMHTLQHAWDVEAASPLSVCAQMARDQGVKHYATVQGFTMSDRRAITAQENLCMVNICLAYGVSGILYWHYYGCGDSDENDGFVDGFAETGTRTAYWNQVKDVIGPYIDKMGPIFASLEWQDAKKYTPNSYPQFHLVDSISSNQYSGSEFYLQVAFFQKPGDEAQYYMLVNRRCLPSETISGRVFLEDRIEVLNNGRPDTLPLRSDEPCPPPPCLDRWWVTNMETGNSVQCDRVPPNCECGSQFFNYSLGPGAAKLFRISAEQPPAPCRHGDTNRDGSIDISDAVFLISYIFSGGASPDPLAAGDANCDGAVDISDAVFLISYIFSSGSAPCPGC